MMELLAPAGGFDQLRAAIDFGADAVYLAADRFGMRARAANFPLDEVARAVECAHGAGVKVYVTCNVTIMEGDLAALPAFLEAVDAAGADALIIGDLGAFMLARRYAPRCRLHVSTQANVANAEAARAWFELGASRIVCAREMTLADIASMRQEVPRELELEAFVHGAQCMAVSGRCLISSYLTGRSGNRGHCTQPCRWQYALEEEKRPGEFFPVEESDDATFIMNAKDLNMVSHLAELDQAGIDSIKIEGRNKKAFYVATVVGAYRRALDALDGRTASGLGGGAGSVSTPAGGAASALTPAKGELAPEGSSGLLDELEAELRCVSHRPYSSGFYFGKPEQASDFDGYEQETLHVADVLACTPQGASAGAGGDTSTGGAGGANASGGAGKIGGAFALTLRCRNRFAEGDELEVLAPRAHTRVLTVKNLCWQSVDATGEPAEIIPVEVANRATDTYFIDVDFAVPAGSFLRVRKHRRSARHAE